MDKALFERVTQSMSQMNESVDGKRGYITQRGAGASFSHRACEGVAAGDCQ